MSYWSRRLLAAASTAGWAQYAVLALVGLGIAAEGLPTLAHGQSAATWQCVDGMDALLRQLSQVRTMRAHYREEKHIALLAAPLVSQGTVYFAAPDVLLRDQQQPARAAMLLDGDMLHFLDESSRRSINLARWQAAQGLVSGYLKVLQGDASGLRKHYFTKFSCEAGGWTLRLSPRTSGLKKLLRHMTLRGLGTRLTRGEMVDAHGDRTLTVFSEHVYQAESRAQLRRRFEAGFGSPRTR